MSNIDKQLDEILAQYENNLWNRDVRDGMFGKALTNEQAKQAIKQLINQARRDELEHTVSLSEQSDDDLCWYEKTRDEYTGTKYYSEVRHLSKADRLKELRGNK